MILCRTDFSHQLLRGRWLRFYQDSHFSVVSPAVSSSSPVTGYQVSDLTSDKSKSFNTSYVNSVLLLGTVMGIKMFPMQSNPDRNWALLFLRTRLPVFKKIEDKELTETPDTNEFEPKFKQIWLSSSNRVHVFSPKLVCSLRDVKLGERLLVSGFLSYYQSSKLDGKASRQCCVTAQRIAHMGWSYDYQHDNNLEEIPET
ncbi:hypothetical protein MN116_000916 [Schistosoma mekongi]|uniref:Uncharacterized protein n=1 Tax=Schistosoma mekongi TaxID=38744 RepID=A0AAE2D8V6_SCHME|nr:hypothetical protein MN116_000916 [Schistosoma mekongi]